jgi:hypothetical protein
MWVELEDSAGDVGLAKCDDELNKVMWHQWRECNIDFSVFEACDVNMEDIKAFRVGIGGYRVGQAGETSAGGWAYGDIYFDDIRLYPARCVPAFARRQGSFRYINRYLEEGNLFADCKVDNYDLCILSTEEMRPFYDPCYGKYSGTSNWLISEIGPVTASEPCDANLVGYWKMNDNANSSTVTDSSTNARHGTLYSDYKVKKGELVEGKTSYHDVAGVKGTALTFDGDNDFVSLPALFDANTNTLTISAWLKTDAIDEDTFMSTILGANDPCNPPKLTLGHTGNYDVLTYWSNQDLAYYWTGWAWDVHPELIMPTKIWSFVALTAEPNLGTLYLSDGKKIVCIDKL